MIEKVIMTYLLATSIMLVTVFSIATFATIYVFLQAVFDNKKTDK